MYAQPINSDRSVCRYDSYATIALWADDQTTFTGNWIFQNEVSFSLHGINMYADPNATNSHNLIRDKTIYHNLEVGIVLEAGAENNLIMFYLVETNHGMSIFISGNYNKVAKNHVLSNAIDGINDEGNFNIIFGNISLDNDGWNLADYGLHNRWLLNEYETANWE